MADLVVGDIHATPDELKDVESLMHLIDRTIKTQKPSRLVFLGDLHHTFAVTNVKVMGFYRSWFKSLSDMVPVVALVGNHDMPGTGAQTPHALLAYEDLIEVIDRPAVLDKTLFLPYYADPAAFHKAVDVTLRLIPDITLIYCHQEFNGAAYDNGFFAPHGADPARMTLPTISGHIHTPQKLGLVDYVGAPRWRTLSDANIERHIHLVKADRPGSQHLFPTGVSCKRIWSARFVEGEDTPSTPESNDKDEFRFYVEGSPEYVQRLSAAIHKEFERPRISTIIKDKRIKVRESDGIDVAFKKYAFKFAAKNATPANILMEKAVRLLGAA